MGWEVPRIPPKSLFAEMGQSVLQLLAGTENLNGYTSPFGGHQRDSQGFCLLVTLVGVHYDD